MIYVADDFAAIRKELDRIEAEKSAKVNKPEPEYQTYWETHVQPAIDNAQQTDYLALNGIDLTGRN